jgi:mRNA interferase MazF
MKRGEIWTVAGGSDYAGKPRPVVIMQDDRFDATASVTVCGLTTSPSDAPLFRISISPDAKNGLRAVSHLMADKITTVARAKIGTRVGVLAPEDMAQLNRAVILFLNLLQTS